MMDKRVSTPSKRIHGDFFRLAPFLFTNLRIYYVKVTWLQLTPFIKTVIIYFVVREFDFFKSNALSTVLKCAPIVCLMAFLFFMGLKFTREFRYHQLILGGLVFSAIGDAFLDYQNGGLFQYGMLAFAVAQIFYISAFGWKPLKFCIGLVFYAIGGFAVSLMFKSFEGILVFGVPIYTILLLTMSWRSNARVQSSENLPKLLAAIGGVLFVVSDAILAYNMFYAPISSAKLLVMTTYYIAQLGITLSTLDHDLLVARKIATKSN